ncbi:AI-2E family transporter [Candidatus Peregrinibacteria bacterium]|nr:AI-2E family transporter [Candidatus Peregrinibacteria bacterium]
MHTKFEKLLRDSRQSVSDLKQKLQAKLAEIKKTQEENPLVYSAPSEPKSSRMLIDLSVGSIAKAMLVVILLYVLTQFVFEIRDILLIFFVALLFSAALDPTVDFFETKRIPRSISILIIYVLIFLILGIFISNFIPLVAVQVFELANRVGDLISNLTTNGTSDIPFFDTLQPIFSQFLEGIDKQTMIDGVKTALLKIGEQLQGVAGNAWKALKVIFDGIFNVILVLVVTFFMTLNARGIDAFIKSIFPSRHTQYIISKSAAVKVKIGAWLRGQVMLSISIGILVTIGLLILGVPYAATLGMIAAITEFVPYLGPIMAAVPAVLIGMNESVWLALSVVIMYFVIQELENNILVPLVMKRAVGLSPIIIIFSMLVGAKFLGVLGIILAIPVTTIIWIFLKDYLQKTK